MLGSWEVSVKIASAPQKVITAFDEFNDKIVGASYSLIAYLGSQQVNGVNHALLAEQTILTGKDIKNVVVMYFHETKEGVTLSGIERVVESGGELGGIEIKTSTDFPEDAQEAFDVCFSDFVGAKIEPFAFLGSQMTKGIDYIFAATVTPVVKNATPKVSLICINAMTGVLKGIDLLVEKTNTAALGYAFTWLAYEGKAIAAPLAD